MMKENINISKIETFLYGKFNKKVSNNTFVGTLPDTTKESWSDMCLIDCGSIIYDNNAYGTGVVLVYLYAKPLANGAKNVKVMSSLEKKLNGAIADATNEDYMVGRLNTYCDYDNERKWHCNIVELRITIL